MGWRIGNPQSFARFVMNPLKKIKKLLSKKQPNIRKVVKDFTTDDVISLLELAIIVLRQQNK